MEKTQIKKRQKKAPIGFLGPTGDFLGREAPVLDFRQHAVNGENHGRERHIRNREFGIELILLDTVCLTLRLATVAVEFHTLRRPKRNVWLAARADSGTEGRDSPSHVKFRKRKVDVVLGLQPDEFVPQVVADAGEADAVWLARHLDAGAVDLQDAGESLVLPVVDDTGIRKVGNESDD